MSTAPTRHEPLTFDDDGHLVLDFGLWGEGWREASCCECGEPVRWVLDMASFKSVGGGRYVLGHARCLWTPEGFDREKAAAAGPDTDTEP